MIWNGPGPDLPMETDLPGTDPGRADGTRRGLTGGGPPRQLRPTDVKRLNREWRRRTEGRLALLLDSVGQPFNVGSIIRTAAAFGVESVWLCGNTPTWTCPPWQDRARHRPVPVRVPDPVPGRRGQGGGRGRLPGHRGGTRLGRGPALRRAPGRPGLPGDRQRGPRLLPGPLSAVHGVAYIPQVGRVGSLNVAVAAAIALAEARRREWTDRARLSRRLRPGLATPLALSAVLAGVWLSWKICTRISVLSSALKSFKISGRRTAFLAVITRAGAAGRLTRVSLSRRYAADHRRSPGVPGRRRYSGRGS